jgi:hypothetical protein
MPIAYLLIAVAVAAFVFLPLFRSQGEVSRASARDTKRRQLIEHRERVLDAIRELDFDHRMGKLEDGDYHPARKRLEAEALDVLHQLDQGNGRAEPVEDLIEREVAALRGGRGKA